MSACAAGYRFLAELKASGELAAAARQRAEAAELRTVRTLREVARVAYGDIGRLFDAEGKLIQLADLDEDVRAIIASIELWPDGTPKKIKLWSKIEVLDMAMRHAGLFERDNGQSQQNMILQVNLVDPPKREGLLPILPVCSVTRRPGADHRLRPAMREGAVAPPIR